MTHQYYELDNAFLINLKTVFLVHKPKQLIVSFVQIEKVQTSSNNFGLQRAFIPAMLSWDPEPRKEDGVW